MKKLLMALAATTLLASPALADKPRYHNKSKARIVLQVNPYSYNYGYNYGYRYQSPYHYQYHAPNYGYSYGYVGPIWLDHGVYHCRKRTGQVGILTTRWGQPITRYNAHYYYTTRNLRCR